MSMDRRLKTPYGDLFTGNKAVRTVKKEYFWTEMTYPDPSTLGEQTPMEPIVKKKPQKQEEAEPMQDTQSEEQEKPADETT